MPPPPRHLRTQAPARVKPPQLDNAESPNETAIVQAIQTLDATWKGVNLETNPEVMERKRIANSSPRVSNALRKALCTFLEIAACFNKPELENRAKLVTLCAARVLGCLGRFVANCIDTEHSIGECCERKCEQRLIHVTALSILFCMCREPEVACNVVKENLHDFLINMCSGVENEVKMREDQAVDFQDGDSFDPHDLMIAVDPFDWCYQSLCTQLLKENAPEFFIPIGIGPLICLLRGDAIPTDEVSEFEQRAPTHKSSRDKSPRRRKLPSIFSFPLSDDDDSNSISTKKRIQHKLASLCCESRSTWLEQCETRAVWRTVLHDGSLIHLAVRSLIALAINLPRQSNELRTLLRHAESLRRVFQKYASVPAPNDSLEKALALLDNDVPLLPIQTVATQASTLKRLACSALRVFGEERKATFIEDIPRQQTATSDRRTLRPIKKKGEGAKKRGGCDSRSLQARLKAVSRAAQVEFEESSLLQKGDVQKSQRRLAIGKMCADVESLRRHFVDSLGVLCSGRQHPDPQQTFSEWIKSLPTLETLERERRYQQEVRQRHILEQQYQREAVRRRERDECTLMCANDYNVPEECELSVQQQKHEQILRMRAEIRRLEQGDISEDTKSGKAKAKGEQELSKKEKLAIQERQRLQQLEDQRREGRELERMRREDLYYVERILQAKAKAREEQEKREKPSVLQKNALEEQQRHIARMRLLDAEKRIAERESIALRAEELLGRQMRFREAEQKKEELQNEWHERKVMQAEEHDCRSRWILWDRILAKQQQEELKHQRAEARRLKRKQQRQDKDVRAAWMECWDENGNRYFYNSITGISQWESPS